MKKFTRFPVLLLLAFLLEIIATNYALDWNHRINPPHAATPFPVGIIEYLLILAIAWAHSLAWFVLGLTYLSAYPKNIPTNICARRTILVGLTMHGIVVVAPFAGAFRIYLG